ncbi:MAG: hypothetical protein AAFQ82_25740, partial [Myxococcota bacterium]
MRWGETHGEVIEAMKVGSRADYGLRAVVYLASLPDQDAPQQISVIAKRQQIPEDYLRSWVSSWR